MGFWRLCDQWYVLGADIFNVREKANGTSLAEHLPFFKKTKKEDNKDEKEKKKEEDEEEKRRRIRRIGIRKQNRCYTLKFKIELIKKKAHFKYICRYI